MELNPAARVGMLVVVAAILMGLVVVQVGQVGPEDGVSYYVLFEDVAGLQTRAPVHLSGVRIGYVAELQLNPENRVRATIQVTRPDVQLFSADYYIYTITGNLLGDKWMEIRPGPVPAGVSPVAAGDQVLGTSPVTLDDLAREGNKVMLEFQDSVAALNDLIGDSKFQSDIKLTMTNFREISGNLKGASQDARTLVKGLNTRVENLASSLDRVVAHVDSTVLAFQDDARVLGANLRGATGTVNQLMARNAAHVDTIVMNLRQMSSSLQRTASTLEGLAADESLRDDVMAAVHNIRKASEEVQAIAGDIRSLTGDPQVQDDLRQTVANAREASESAKRVAGKVEGIVSGDGGPLFQADVSHEWNTQTGEPAANLNAFLLPRGPFTVKAGVDSLGQDNLVNLQAGRTWDSFRLRGGVVRSQFGVGADAWLFNRRFEANVDVYDTRDVKVDVLGKVLFPSEFYIYGGVRDATDARNSYPIVGAGKRF
ncbi:MAG: MlaD family protein [Candidatus Xenobium sp.]|jgi:phospholipid/cholesterol/gamma-HCH transport system substrate-binding protein|nr:MCE family protein [Burkholderiales bacterium]